MATLLEKCNNIKNDKELNLKPENLKEGITCLGVTGTLKEGTDTSDATAGPYDIAQGTSAYVNGEKVEGALPVYEAGDIVNSGTIQYSTPEIKIRISEDCILHEHSTVVIDELALADSAQIDSSMIMSGNQVLGVYGTATEDADATSDDLLEMKTAYSQGQRIYGTIGNWRGTPIPVSTDNVRAEENDIYVEIHPEVQATGYNSLAIDNGCGMQVMIPNYEVAESINLIPDMIVEGNRVLGIDGTARLGYDTSDADATSDNIEPGYSAYTRDGLVHGSMTVAEGMTFDSVFDRDKPEYRIFYDEPSNNIEQIFRNDKKILLVDGTELDIRVSGADIAEAAGITPDKIVEGNTILGISGSATAGANGPFIYRHDSENTSIAILAHSHQGHLDYYDATFFDTVLSGAKELRYGKWLQNNRTYLSVDTSEYMLLDTFYTLFEKAQAAGMNNEHIADDIFYLNGWYFNLGSGSYYEDENGELLPGAMDFTDYHGGYRIAFIRTGNGIFVADVQSLSSFTETVDVTVEMTEPDGLLSSITFSYETGVTSAECVVNNGTMTQIEAWFPDNTEYTRTFLFTRDSYEFDNAERLSAYNGNPIHYQYLSDVDAHKYVWLSNETEGIYLSMLSKNEQTITQIGDIIERVSYTINSRN